MYLKTQRPGSAGVNWLICVTLETGDKKYYWLENVVAVGMLAPAKV
jgi:hypothetical protein